MCTPKRCRGFGTMKDRKSTAQLVERLQKLDPGRNPWAAQQLAKELGEKKVKEAVPRLLEILEMTGALTTGKEVMRALGAIGDPRALEPLIYQLKAKSSTAAWALGDLGDIRAVEPLIEALSSSEYLIRGSAARSLGVLGDERGVEPLKKLLKDQEDWVRKNVMQALAKLGVSDAAGLDEWVLEHVSPQEEAKRLVELDLVEKAKIKRMYHRGIRRVLSPSGKKIDPAVDELVMVSAKIGCGACLMDFPLPDPFKLSVRGSGDEASCQTFTCPGCGSENEICGYLTESPEKGQECWIITDLIFIPLRFRESPYLGWPDPDVKKISVETSSAGPQSLGDIEETLNGSKLKFDEIEKEWDFKEAISKEEKKDLVLTNTVGFENLKKMSVYKILPLWGQEIASSDMFQIEGILKCSVCQKESSVNFKLGLQGFFKSPSQHSVKCQYCSSSDMMVGVTTEVKKGEKKYWLLAFRDVGPLDAYDAVPRLKVEKLAVIKSD